MDKIDRYMFCENVANATVQALVREVELSPKPGLVDRYDAGSHDDLTYTMMKSSAFALKETFREIASVSYGRKVSQSLREDIAEIGRNGELKMYEVTCGVNTHKGAIWALGLLVSAYATNYGKNTMLETLKIAGKIASFKDEKYKSNQQTNGQKVKITFRINGAKEEAEAGFPHIVNYSLPALQYANELNFSEENKWKCVLTHLMANLNDTCILHRGGMLGLKFVMCEAEKIIKTNDFTKLGELNNSFIRRNLSPGGSADLLAATMFLDFIYEKA